MQCAVKIFMLLTLDIIWRSDITRASRPARPIYNRNLNARYLSYDEMQKARARWNADILSRATDDEDLIIDPENGSGADIQNDAGGQVDRMVSQSYLGSEYCCRLGKIAAKRERSCHSAYYVNRLKAVKMRYRLRNKNSRGEILDNSQWRPEDRIIRLFKRCALRRNSNFQKCCIAVSASYKRKQGRRSKYQFRRRWRQRGRHRY